MFLTHPKPTSTSASAPRPTCPLPSHAFYRQDSTTVVDPDTGEEHVQLEGEPYLVSTTHDYAIDIVGVIYEPTGETLTDAEGNEYPAKLHRSTAGI
jgi:hypothetical protein